MAEYKGGLPVEEPTSTEDKEPSVGVQQKFTKGPYGTMVAAPSSALVTDPRSQSEILANMQRFIDEREKQQNSLLSALNYASLYGSGGAEGPWRALQSAEEQQSKQAAEMFNMRQAIAQQRGAQAIQQEFVKSNLAQGWLGSGTSTTGGAELTAGGGSNFIPDYMAKQFFDIARTEGIPAANKFKNQYLQDQARQQTTFLNTKASYEKDIGIINEKGEYELINAIEAKDRIMNGKAKLATMAPPSAEKPEVKGAPFSLEQLQGAVQAQEKPAPGQSKVSAAGAIGPMQITPATWNTYVAKGIIPKDWDINNDEQNIKAGNAIIGDLYGKYKGDHQKVLAEYYGGAGAINKDGTIRTDVTPKEGIPGPSVGGYIDQVTRRIQATPTAAPTATYAQKKQEFEVEKTYQEALGKEDIAKRKDFETESDPITVGRMVKQNERMMDVVKNNPSVVGVFADPGIKNAVLSYLQGRQDMSREDLEDVIFKANADSTTDMNQRREVARYLAEMAIRSRQLLKGSGQISDYEQRVLDRMTGSIKDPAELLYKTAQLVKARDKYLLAAREAYDKGDFKRMSEFNKSEKVKSLRNAYFDEIDDIYKSEPDFGAARVKRKTEMTDQEKAVRDIIAKQNKPKS